MPHPRRAEDSGSTHWVLLVVITGMTLAVAIQGEQYSTIRETPLRHCQNQEVRILALSPTVASVTKTGT